MNKNLQIGKLNCECYIVNSSQICYILTPLRLDSTMLTEFSDRFKTTIVSISGIDWDNDLTPWPAPGAEKYDADFKGNAAEFLQKLSNEVISRIESEVIHHPVVRTLLGISLSGLFAVWAWMQDATFNNIASISGSFWYDDFTQWLHRLSIPHKPGCAYFSLGDKEGGLRGNPRFRTVANDTAEVIKELQSHGVTAMFEQTQGTHYAPIYPRLEKALTGLNEMLKPGKNEY